MKKAPVIPVLFSVLLSACDLSPAGILPALPVYIKKVTPSLVSVTGYRYNIYKKTFSKQIPDTAMNSTLTQNVNVLYTFEIFGDQNVYTSSISDTFYNMFFYPGALPYTAYIIEHTGGTSFFGTLTKASTRAQNVASLNTFYQSSDEEYLEHNFFGENSLTLPYNDNYPDLPGIYANDTVNVPLSASIAFNTGLGEIIYNHAILFPFQRNISTTFTSLNAYVYTQITVNYAPDTKVTGVIVHDIVDSHTVNGNEITLNLKSYTPTNLYSGYVASFLLAAENGEESVEYLRIK
jgi:hypothetical protein